MNHFRFRLVTGAGVAIAGGVAISVGSVGAASAQGSGGGYPPLTPASIDVRTGDLRRQLTAYEPNQLSRSTQPAWIVSSSIGVDIGVTDNAQGTSVRPQADLFGIVSPSITISGDTPRAQINASYSPQAYFYVQTGNQTRVDQFGNARALISVVPGSLFLDLRGSISENSRTGGLGTNGGNSVGGNSTAQNQQDQVQSLSFSVTPYAEHRFGGTGTARIGYSFVRTLQDANNTTNYNQFAQQQQLQQAFNTSGLNNGGITGNLTTQRERASFVTGEDLGRFNVFTVAEAVQYSGAGAYHNAHRNQLNVDLGYAISRTVTLVAGTGYQDLRFSGTPGYRISEPIWSVGVRLTPDPQSTITIGYGRRDGANSLYLDANTAPTARTRVYARYSQGLSTDAEQQQNLLQSTTVGSTGLLTDSTTGAPVSSGGSQFGTQNGLYRLSTFSIGGSLALNRDTFSVSIANENRANISAVTFGPGANGTALPVLPAGSSSNGTFGSLSWQHELTPVMVSSVSASYGISDFSNLGSAGASRQTTISGQAALSYQFTETLSGSVRYQYTERSSGQSQTLYGTQGNLVQNTLLAGLRKSF